MKLSRCALALAIILPCAAFAQGGGGGGSGGGSAGGGAAAGTAASSGSSAAAAQTAPAGGIGRPATTNQQDSDAKIDQENSNTDRMVGSICKNCK
jgi:hypothetical protein